MVPGRHLVTIDMLTSELRGHDAELYALAARYLSTDEFECTTFIPTQSNITELARLVALQMRSIECYQAPHHLQFFKAHLLEFCDWLRVTLYDDLDYPVNRLRYWIAAIQKRLKHVSNVYSPIECSEFLIERFDSAHDFFEAITQQASHAPPSNLEHCLSRIAPFREELISHTKTLQMLPNATRLLKSLGLALRALDGFKMALTSLILQPREVQTRISFEDMVISKYGFDLEFIQSWYKSDLEAHQNHLRALARTFGSSDNFVEVFQKELAPYDTADAMKDDAEKAISTAREFAKTLVYLPPGEHLTLADVPETDRDKLPFGAYMGGDVYRGVLRGHLLINMRNLSKVTRGWIWMMALHEGYPGHHVHYIKTSANGKLPLTFRIPSYGPAQGLIEGAAHRSEIYLKEIGSGRGFALMAAYRQLQTLLRIKTQFQMSVEQVPLEEAMKEYTNALGLDHFSATSLLRSQIMNPGRTFSYYTGMRVLRDLQTRLRISEADFTDALFSLGFVSLATMERVLEQKYLLIQ